MCGVAVWRGGSGGTYRLPALSFAGASKRAAEFLLPGQVFSTIQSIRSRNYNLYK